MAKQDNNRKRVSLPVSGLDTSTPDLTVADGKCEELHNLRWETGSWHNIDPLKVKHRLAPTDDNRELFSKLSIIYHHPAAGEDVYIASAPNDDGSVDLFQVIAKNGILKLKTTPENLCPVYIYSRKIIINVEIVRPAVSIVSLQPVASDISVELKYQEIIDPGEFTVTLTIPKGATTSETEHIYFLTDNDSATVVPDRDDTYNYVLYPDKAAALDHYSSTFAINLPADIQITHFGNILIVMDSTNQQIHYYYFLNGAYRHFQIPSSPIIRQSLQLSADGLTSGGEKCTKYKYIDQDESVNNEALNFFNTSTGVFYFPQTDNDFWWGEICYFAVFQMKDGQYMAPSPLVVSASEVANCSQESRVLAKYAGLAYKVLQIPSLFSNNSLDGLILMNNGGKPGSVLSIMVQPFITISIPEDIDSDMIGYVNIYSTRINPIWDAVKLSKIEVPEKSNFYLFDDFRAYFADNKLPEQPFYLMKSIPVTDFEHGKFEMYITAELLKNIEQNTIYEPIGAHTILYTRAKEYNSRLHVADETERLFSGYGCEFFPETSQTPPYEIRTNLLINNTNYCVKSNAPQPLNSQSALINNKILSYPDYRATFMCSPAVEENAIPAGKVELKTAIANNFAYAIHNADYETYNQRDGYYVKYSTAIYKAFETISNCPDLTDTIVSQPNKLRVSAQNNPFSFPLANSYSIGTENNRLLAVNSAAIEMSDAKFGEFPLFVFTDEGIFTLQSGSGEVLYSATIPLNYDRILNPETLAVNHNVLYVTARGLQAMFSNQSKLISESLNDLHNTPPLDYLCTAKMCYQPAHNEVIVWNPDHTIGRAAAGTRAYVYSLDGGYWSTRDFSGVKLNTSELFLREQPNLIRILDLTEEEARPDRPVPIRLVSRPIKFGSAEFKRLETFIPRLRASAPQSMRLIFEGSNDLREWITLRDTGFFRTDRDTTVRRFPSSVRFLRITLETDTYGGFELSLFDAEYYLRFLHRLR